MSHKLDKLSTGMRGLDDDLRELFAICEDKEKLSTIKEAIANEDISSEEFSKVVPEVLVTFSLFLTGPQFILLLDDINEEAVDLVKDAKSLIEKHFGNLFENENAKLVLKKITGGQQDGSEFMHDEVIRRVGYYLLWGNEPPTLMPTVQMALKNRKRKILLKSSLDWEDFSLLLRKLSSIFLELLEKGKPLAELGQIDSYDSQEIVKNIEETLGNLQKMKKIMPIYKAKTETDSNKQSVKDSSN